jgi:predicted DNA-binding transcriptional regulator YafY
MGFMVDRLFQIVYTLMNQDTVTCGELAEKFECSTRTIMRDIDKLSLAGVPVYANKGKGGGISLLSNFVLDRTVLTDDERSRILSSLQAIQETGYGEEQETLTKLSSLFGTVTQDWIEIEFSRWGESGKEELYFKQIKEAILKRRVIEIKYAASHEACSQRKVKPLKLCYRGYAWYVYGFCMLRNDYRFFKLKRIVEFTVMNEAFTSIRVGRVMSEPIEQGKGDIHIKLQVYHQQLYRVLEELPRGVILEDGSMITEFDAKDESAIISYILSLGAYTKVLEPAWLQEKVREQIDRLKRLYDNIE